MANLIGLIGRKQSGKSTSSAYLVQYHGYREYSFADSLKRACIELFDLQPSQVYGTEEEKTTPDPRWFGCTPRKMLQYVGTDLLRNQLDTIMPGLGTGVFTHHFSLKYQRRLAKNPDIRVVVSDVRFVDEARVIKELGGKLIRLYRYDESCDDCHISEREMDLIKYDHSILNEGDIDTLYRNLVEAIQ
jgi:hypothetical protein